MGIATYPMKGRNFTSIRDMDPEELMRILYVSRDLKNRFLTGERPELLKGRTLGMIFQKPSLRTVVSFTVAMQQLGGAAMYLGPDQISIGKRETTEDIAEVLSGFVDGIMARVFGHEIIDELAMYSKVPVINGLSDAEHPCQIMGDLLTVWERQGSLRGSRWAFIGDGNNVAASLAYAAARLGFHLVVASPEGYELPQHVLDACAEDIEEFSSGGSVTQVRDPKQAVAGADAVYTDVWASMGQEAEKEERARKFAGYMIDCDLVDLAKPSVAVLHCLPAHYGDEIDFNMQRDPRSAIYPQAENRLHAQKGVLALLLQ